MKRISIFLLVLLFSCAKTAIAGDFRLNVGASVIETSLDNKDFVLKQEGNLNASVGASYFSDNKIVISISTNRIFSEISEGAAIQRDNNRAFTTKTKNYTDVISIGKFANSNLLISLFVASNKSKTDFYFRNNKHFSDVEVSYLSGLSASYFLNKNISISAFYATPIKSDSINNAFGSAINYYF